MRGEKKQISTNLASHRNVLCAVTRNVEAKSKTMVFISYY